MIVYEIQLKRLNKTGLTYTQFEYILNINTQSGTLIRR